MSLAKTISINDRPLEKKAINNQENLQLTLPDYNGCLQYCKTNIAVVLKKKQQRVVENCPWCVGRNYNCG